MKRPARFRALVICFSCFASLFSLLYGAADAAIGATTAQNAQQLVKAKSNQYVQTNPSRLSHARAPRAGDGTHFQNANLQQSNGDSDISEDETLGSDLIVNRTLTPAVRSAAGNQLGASSVTVSNGGAANVPINLTTDSAIEAIQFTVTYDPAKLSITSPAVSITNCYPNTTFTFNASTPGKIGVEAYQPLDGSSTFPAGTDKLFDINFTVVAGATGQTTVDFGDTPVHRAASNPQAQSVSFTTAAGTVTIPAQASSFSISGSVADGSGANLAGVTVTLSGSSSAVTTTDSFGN